MRKGDKWIIVSALILSLAPSFLLNFSNQTADVCEITANGKQYGTYPLHTPRTIVVHTQYGSNTVEIKNNRVFITDATCKDKQCVGEVLPSAGVAVCLPNRVVVRVTCNKEADLIAY